VGRVLAALIGFLGDVPAALAIADGLDLDRRRAGL
jgi:hypothetical protein